MKRRKFLIDSASAVAGLAATGNVFAAPCPPLLDNNSNGNCPVISGGGDLSSVAAKLGAGQTAAFTSNTTQRENDIQWMTKALHYDPVHGEIRYIGKPASGQSRDWVHYEYRETSDSWSRLGVVANGAGHSWLSTMDPATGDYYWNDGQGSDVIHRYDRNSRVWRNISLNNTQIGSLAHHPNLFGAGNPGIFIWEGDSYYCYRLSDGSMHNVGPTEGSGGITGKTSRCRNGTGDYVASRNSVVCGAKGWETGSTRRPAIEVKAGAGNSSNAASEGTIVYQGEAPVVIYGGGGGSRHGKLVSHPSDGARVLLLEGFGTDRVWDSTDGGNSWNLKSYNHPFGNMNGWVDHWTLGRISEYGIIVAMSSDGNGGQTILWKPNS